MCNLAPVMVSLEAIRRFHVILQNFSSNFFVVCEVNSTEQIGPLGGSFFKVVIVVIRNGTL